MKMWRGLRKQDARLWSTDDMIRAELFGPDRLEQHATSLAEAQASGGSRAGGQVLARRLRDNEAVLLKSYRAIARAVETGQSITPCGRVDPRQLSHRRGADLRDQGRPAGRLLSPAAPDRGGSFCRPAAGLRDRLGLRRPHGQPLRCRHPVSHAGVVSARPSPDHRRDLGGRDHPSHRAGRESSPCLRSAS